MFLIFSIFSPLLAEVEIYTENSSAIGFGKPVALDYEEKSVLCSFGTQAIYKLTLENGEIEELYGKDIIKGNVFYLKRSSDKENIVCLTAANTLNPTSEKCYVLDSKTYEIKYEKDISGYASIYYNFSLFSPDNEFFAVVTPKGSITIFETDTGNLIRKIDAHIFIPEWKNDSAILKTPIKPSDTTLKFLSFDEFNERITISLQPLMGGYAHTDIYELKTGKLLKSFKDAVLKFSLDEKFLISESLAGHELYDAYTYRLIKKLIPGSDEDKIYNSPLVYDGNLLDCSSILTSDKKFKIEARNLSDIHVSIQNDNEETSEIYKTNLFDNAEWVSMTPDGYYNCSAHGDEFVNIRYDLNAFPISQFGKAYFHPEVIEHRIKGDKDPNIVNYFGDIKLSAEPPSVSIEKIGNISQTNEVELKISIIDASQKYNLENICIFINGRQLGQQELKKVNANNFTVTKNNLGLNKKVEYLNFSLPVILESGKNYIEVTAANEACYGIGTLMLKGKNISTESPDLWIMAIGINNYSNLPQDSKSGLTDLKNAVNDSNKIIKLFTEKNSTYKNIHLCQISDTSSVKPSYENIKSYLNFFTDMNENDVALLFIASHGVYANDNFYFLPMDVSFDNSKTIPDFSHCINTQDILNTINVPGRKIVLIDTCQSGSIGNNVIVKTLENKSVAVFAAAQANELAQESDDYGGHFTFSISKYFDENKESSVSLGSLAEFVDDEVKQLSRFGGRGKIRQHPMILIPDGLTNYIIK